MQLRDIVAPTFARQSTRKWWLGYQPNASRTLYGQEDFWYPEMSQKQSQSSPQGQGQSTAARIGQIEEIQCPHQESKPPHFGLQL
jgi:hypothetical protein